MLSYGNQRRGAPAAIEYRKAASAGLYGIKGADAQLAPAIARCALKQPSRQTARHKQNASAPRAPAATRAPPANIATRCARIAAAL